MSVVLAGDVGPAVGLGHRRRLEAIGAALGALGRHSTFVPIEESGDNDVGGQDLVVVDSYLTRADDQSRYPAGRVVAIDELGRDLAVDLVIDPTPGAVASGYSWAPTRVLAGAAYALVAPEFAAPPEALSPTVRRILVTFGASPAARRAPAIATAIAHGYPEIRCQVALGPWVDEPVPGGIDVLTAVGGLDPAMRSADLVITSGGVTMLEACAAGRPTVALAIAENQRNAVSALESAGAIAVADVDSVVDVAHRLIGDAERRSALGARARETVDGRGAERAATAIVELLGRSH